MENDEQTSLTRDRFDLEQEILECWKVTNDLKTWAEQGADSQDYQTLAAYYERKFDRLWDTFELLIKSQKIV